MKITCKAGDKFTAKIEGVPVRGKIQLEDKVVYLCQNEKDGQSCKNKLGYKYSWSIGSDNEDDTYDVIDLVINDEKVHKDDILISRGGTEYTVGATIDEIVFLLYKDSFHSIQSQADIKKNGYILKNKEEIVELTFEDISNGKGKGIPPHLIRIKEEK